MRRPILSTFASFAIVALGAVFARAETFEGRHYDLHDGRSAAGPAPLVLALHGAGGAGPHLRRSSGFDALASEAGVVAVYPSAPEKRWNDGRWAAIGRADLAARDDVAWLVGLTEDLVGRGLVDPERVYVLGHSNGGGMAMRLACRRPDLIAGIAVVSTKMLIEAPCEIPGPKATVVFYGTEDVIAPHGGRNGPVDTPLTRDLGRTYSAEESVAAFRDRNRCAGEGATTRLDPDPTDGVSIALTDWTDCAAPLRYFEMIGGGHAFPGAPAVRVPFLRRLIGDPIRDVDAGREALRFWFGD